MKQLLIFVGILVAILTTGFVFALQAEAAGCTPFLVASGGTGNCGLKTGYIPFGGATNTSAFATSTNLFENTVGNLLFTFGSSTALTVSGTGYIVTASTTNLSVGGVPNCNASNALTTNSSGVVGCTAQPQGTVTSISVATANGFAGSSGGGATPILTLSTTVTGLLLGNGTAASAYGGTSCTYSVLSLNASGVATCGGFAYPFPNNATSTPSFTISFASSTAHTISGELNVPHSTSVPSLVAGDLYVNTNGTASSSIVLADGTTNNTIFAAHSVPIIVASSTLAYVGSYINGTSPYFLFGTGTASTTATLCSIAGTAVTYGSNNTWQGRQPVYVAIGTSAGTTTLKIGNPLHSSTLLTAFCSMDAATPNIITITADVEDKN